ncbi:hypothetical protein MLD38_003838 [Melastoma candidum]|uniref:Uncharacterized protein n=2 Tax=Melastoma candidum TaxID=119954 RepID=A0ACB9S314_9MYRT|nr:hypothetical protein MLD38_003836 [Melastoma candidum]KAI4385848.1 hypothetical protein MLD38_003838 [Melastoma candidum]
MDSAMVTAKYDVGNVTYTREHFASYPDQVVMVKISASRPDSGRWVAKGPQFAAVRSKDGDDYSLMGREWR